MKRLHLFCPHDRVADAETLLTAMYGEDQSGSFCVSFGGTVLGCSGLFDSQQEADLAGAAYLTVVESPPSFWQAAAARGFSNPEDA